jgi:hypothetical protein
MRRRQDEIKAAVRIGVRKIGYAQIEGDLAAVMVKRLQTIRLAVEFAVKDVNAHEFSAAVVETFNEIDSERNALEPIARFCEESLEKAIAAGELQEGG